MTTWKYPITLYNKQRLAVSSKADQVLFGGSLAGGKTEMILKHMVDICTLIPGAKVLVVRKNFPQMKEIEQRLRLRIPKDVATLNKSDHVMTFKHNGAELHLGYLDSDDAAENYQGHQYVQIGYDELTHYDRSWVDRVNERLRDPERVGLMRQHGLKIRMLAASNPGSRGHSWVRERFIEPAPHGELFTSPATDENGNPLLGEDGQPIVISRQFIPSSLWDNPYLNHDEYLATLSDMDPERKRAMIYGDWSIPAGTRFPQFRESIHVIKPEEFPIPVVGTVRVVGVDYGINDPMAAVWMAKVGDTIVVYRDHVEEGLASSQQAQRVKELESIEERQHSEVTVALDPNGWARNPAFGGVKLGPGSDEAPLGSIAHYFKEALGDRVVKGWNPRVQGWSIFDELMIERDTGVVDEYGKPVKLPRILIYDTCRDLIKALQSAPRSKRDPQDIDTHWKDDHVCFVGSTPVETEHGPRRIDSVRAGDRVWTRHGLRTVVDARCTARDTVVGEVVLSNGERIVGTGNHPVFLEDGTKVTLDALRYADKLVPWETINKSPQSPSSTTGASTHGHPSRPTGLIGSTTGSEGAESVFTVPSTGTTTGPSRTASTSTTPTMTRSTTPRLTSWLSRRTNTSPTMPTSTGETSSTGLTASSTWTTSGTSQQSGTAPRQGAPGTQSMDGGPGKAEPRSSTTATSAAPSTQPGIAAITASARTLASLRGAVRRAWTTLTGHVPGAAAPSASTSTARPVAAPVSVLKPFVVTGSADVYNLTVDEHHEYFAHGVLVSNCDAARYAVAEILGRQYASPPTGYERMALDAARTTVTGDLGTRGF